MGTLCAGKGCRLDSQARRSGRPDLDLDATLRAGAGYRRVGGLDDSSPARGAAHPQRQADGAGRSRGLRLARFAPLPLALLAQRAGAATANAGGIHHAQASISFSAVFVRNQLLVSRAPKRPIELASKVLAGKAACFPGGSGGRWTIPRRRSGGGWTSGCLRASRWESRSKLGGAHRHRLQLVPQFESDIPDPLADDLPGFLSQGCVAAPAVGVLLAVFIS